jgi:uncharacterized protein (DUF1501 family)
MITRRKLLATGLAAAPIITFSRMVPGLFAQAAEQLTGRDGRILVVVELPGGNDGINTVVPYADEGYERARKQLRLAKERLIRLDDSVGLHQALKPLAPTWEAGQLAIIQGVGYPNPSRSHVQSRMMWHTGYPDPTQHRGNGWIGRSADLATRSRQSIFVGPGQVPVALRGRVKTALSVDRPEDIRFDAMLSPRGPAALVLKGKPQEEDSLPAVARRAALDAWMATDLFATIRGGEAASYPPTELARHLGLVAACVKAGFGASVYYLVHQGEGNGGYDTHVQQVPTHEALLFELASACRAFFDDLARARLSERVALLAFSEFGRRVEENASGGTDQGTAGPVLVAGGAVRGGLVGKTPNLSDLESGDLKISTDFRQVYATILEDWLEIVPRAVLGSEHKKLPLFRVLSGQAPWR